MKSYTIYLFSALLLLACNKQTKSISEITKITLASGDCFGTCTQAAITVDTSLFYIYFGGKYAVRKGHYEGKVSQAYWDSLRHIIDGIDYKKLDTSNNVVDDQLFELVVQKGGKKDHLTFHSSNLPDSVRKAFNAIMDSHRKINVYLVKDNVKFETIVQNEVPTPDIDSVKFPPPSLMEQE